MSRKVDLDMMDAINEGDFMKFEKAIKQGAYINYVSTPDDFVSGNKETTPLIESSFRNSDEIFDYLVQRQDILIDAQNRNGSNAVMLAAMAGRKDRVEKLIARNASLLNRDGDGCDVVDHARAGQHDSLIPWLMQQMNVQRAKSNPRLPPPQP